MDEFMDLIIADDSPSEISDGIKNVLFAKSAEKIDTSKPDVAQAMFGMNDADEDQEVEASLEAGEIDNEVETEEEE